MSKLIEALFILGITSFIGGCSTLKTENPQSITLGKVDKVDLNKVTLDNATSFFGAPTARGPINNFPQQEGFVYLNQQNPPSPRLTLVFNVATKELISANWFVDEKDPESDFSKVQNRYPQTKFDLKNPVLIEDAYGFSMKSYRSLNSPLEVFTEVDSKKVNGISWNLREDTFQEKRKPTSH